MDNSSSAGAAASPIASPTAAMHNIGRLASDLNPSSPPGLDGAHEPGSRSMSGGQTVSLLADGGAVIGTVTVISIGPQARFHFNIVGPEYASVCGLNVTNEAAARRQMAWMDDDNDVQKGHTPLSSITANTIFAAPFVCLQPISNSRR